MALKRKQTIFCEEYVKDYNATQAAIRAGYKESNAASQASRLLKEPDILEEIRKQQKNALERASLTEEKVINQLEEVLSRCLSATPVMEWDYDEHCLKPTGEYQFDSKGALKAIELLGKHLGMFNNKEKRNSNNGAAISQFISVLNEKVNDVWEKEE